MSRLDQDQLGLRLAALWAERGTCARRQVGCVLMDVDGYVLSSGYNGPASGQPHCRDTGGFFDKRCAGADCTPGTGLDLCEAIHAEANSLIRCPDVQQIYVAYITHSPCVHCTKLLMNTSCRRIVFSEPYAHDETAKLLWLKNDTRRTWEHKP